MKFLYTHIRQLVTVASPEGVRRGRAMRDLGVIEDAAILIDNGKIAWLGKTIDFPAFFAPGKTQTIQTAGSPDGPPDKPLEINASRYVALPALIDSHTHLVFAGDRADEYALRAEGKTYSEIAASGGGIAKSVAALAVATEDALVEAALPRLSRMLGNGVETVEIKSGYGLTLEAELKQLRAINRLSWLQPVRILPTFLAHDVPPEYRNGAARRADYIHLLCTEFIPRIAEEKLAVFCDVFCDRGAFTAAESRRILEAGVQHGLQPRIHTDEFESIGGSAVARDVRCLSADHLLALTGKGIDNLLAADSVATLLPGTAMCLGLPYADARKLIDAGLPVALATDYNPGSCLTENLPLMMTLACSQMKMTVEESICAVTINAAKSLGLSHELGSIEVGKQARLTFYDIPDYRYIPYHFGSSHAAARLDAYGNFISL